MASAVLPEICSDPFSRFSRFSCATIFQGEGGHRLLEALARERARGCKLESPFQSRHGLAAGEDLAALRLGAQARGEVGDVADRGVVPAAFEADGAEGGVAL